MASDTLASHTVSGANTDNLVADSTSTADVAASLANSLSQSADNSTFADLGNRDTSTTSHAEHLALFDEIDNSTPAESSDNTSPVATAAWATNHALADSAFAGSHIEEVIPDGLDA